jgi:hypothetical protein
MGFLRRTEVGVNAKMHMNIAAAEPTTSALRQSWRFRHFPESEHADVELACAVFFAARHGELDVIKAGEWSVAHDTPLQFDSRVGFDLLWGSHANYATSPAIRGITHGSTSVPQTTR